MQHRKQGTRSTANLISPHCHKYHCAEQLAMKTQHYIMVVCSTSSQNRKVEKKKRATLLATRGLVLPKRMCRLQTVQALRKHTTAFTVTIGTRDFTGSGRRSGRCQPTRGALSGHAQYNTKVVESRSRWPALPQAQKGEPHKHRSHLGHLVSAGRGLHTVHTNKLSGASQPD